MQPPPVLLVQNLQTLAADRLARRRSNLSHGAAVVELCLCLMILVPLLFATIQMSYIFDATNTLSQIAYTTGRYAASHGRDNTPTDVADNDYNDTNQASVLYAAYQACSSTLIPYGKGVVQGSSNSYTTVNANGATVNILYEAPGTTTPEGTAAIRNPGDTVVVSVTFDMIHHIFMGGMPGITGMISGGHAYVTQACHIILIQ